MSEAKSLARPRQVTTAGVMGVVGSALIVLSLFDALQRIRSVEMREAVDRFLAEPPGDGLGVTTAEALDLLHGLVLFNGALAAAAAVLAIYVFQRHHAARIGFSVAAALLLLVSPVSGGAMAMIVGFAAGMLWSRPARDWFAGRAPAPVPAAGYDASRPGPQEDRPDPWTAPGSRVDDASDPSTGPSTDRPAGSRDLQYPGSSEQRPAPASYPYGSRPDDSSWRGTSTPDPHWAPPEHGADAISGSPSTLPDRRPASVVVAAVVTWCCAGLAALMFSLTVAMLLFSQPTLVEALRSDARFDDLDASLDDLLAAVWVVSAIAIFWSVSAIALAFLAFRRVGWARVLLVVSAAMTALLGLVAFPAGLLAVVPAVAVVVLLFSGGANAWYGGRSGPQGPAGPRGPQPGAPSEGYQPVQRPGKPPVW